jgi:hypothetical protein
MKLRQNFSQRTHLINCIGPKVHALGRFGPFCYCTKVDAKLAEQLPLTHKFAKKSCVEIFRHERTGPTPLDAKLMFRDVADRFFTAQNSMQNWPNWHH